MSLLLRRTIFYILISIFLVVAPILISYAAGFRYNFKQQRIVKTGALIIETMPETLSIQLNNTPRPEQTPAKIMNLTPGEYNIHLSKDEYWTWNKTLSVESERITFAKDIILLRHTIPQLLAGGNIKDTALMPYDDVTLYRIDSTSWSELWKITSGDSSLIWRSTVLAPRFDTLTRGQNMLVRGGRGEALVFSLQKSNTPVDLATLMLIKNPRVQLDPKEPNVAYILENGNLQLVNTRTHVVSALDTNIADMVATNNRLILLTKENKNIKPQIISKQQGISTVLYTLPSGSFELAEPNDNLLPIYNTKTRETFIIDTRASANAIDLSTTPEKITTTPGKAIGFTRGGEELYCIIASDNELWAYNSRTDTKELILRVSESMRNVTLIPQGQLILYTTDRIVRAVELDNRGTRSIWDLATFDKIEKTALSRDGLFMIIAGTYQGKPGLWKLALQ